MPTPWFGPQLGQDLIDKGFVKPVTVRQDLLRRRIDPISFAPATEEMPLVDLSLLTKPKLSTVQKTGIAVSASTVGAFLVKLLFLR